MEVIVADKVGKPRSVEGDYNTQAERDGFPGYWRKGLEELNAKLYELQRQIREHKWHVSWVNTIMQMVVNAVSSGEEEVEPELVRHIKMSIFALKASLYGVQFRYRPSLEANREDVYDDFYDQPAPLIVIWRALVILGVKTYPPSQKVSQISLPAWWIRSAEHLPLESGGLYPKNLFRNVCSPEDFNRTYEQQAQRYNQFTNCGLSVCTVEQFLDYLVWRAIRAKFFGEDPNAAVLALLPQNSTIVSIRCRNSITNAGTGKVEGKAGVQLSYASGVMLKQYDLGASSEVGTMFMSKQATGRT